MRRQHLPDAAADRAARRRWRPRPRPTRPSSRCRTRTRPSARSPSTSSPSSAESDVKPRVFFARLPRPRPLRSRHRRRAAAGATCSSPTPPSRSRRRSTSPEQGRLVDRPRRSRPSSCVLDDGTSHTTYLNSPTTTRAPTSSDARARHRRRDRVPARRRSSRATTRRRSPSCAQTIAENAKHGSDRLQPALHHPAEVLASGGLPRPRADRPGARRQQPQGRQARQLRPRHRRRSSSTTSCCTSSRAAALGGRLPPSLAPWIAEHRARRRRHRAADLAGAIGRSADSHSACRRFWRRRRRPRRRRAPARRVAPRRASCVVVIRIPHFDLPRPTLLDLYVARAVPAVFLLGVRRAARDLLHLDVHRPGRQAVSAARRRRGMLLRYFYFATPQYVYYIIPMAALVATLVTIGVLTKNSELIVMRACGISLYRSALPLLLFAVAAQRRAVRAAGAGARDVQPRGRPPERDHPRLSRRRPSAS